MDERATGIILRIRPLTETSLIVEWLTAELGRISTVAKGARRPKSSFQGKLDLYYECDLGFARSRRSELHTLREVRLVNTRGSLRKELSRLRLAAYAGSLLERATETETPVPEVYALFKALLDAAEHALGARMLVYAFEARLLETLGHGPRLDDPALSTSARAALERCLETPLEQASLPTVPGQTLRELHILLFHGIDQAFGKVPAQREKAVQPI